MGRDDEMADRDDRIDKLEADARVSDAHVARLKAETMEQEEHIAELDARALARDERILALVSEVDGLHTATEHRSVIEQAKGVIMSTLHCSADAAFAVLVQQSQYQNRKLRDIAAELAAAQDHKPSD